jgi:hypothetical protein
MLTAGDGYSMQGRTRRLRKSGVCKRTTFLKPERWWVPRLASPYQLAHAVFEPDDSRKKPTGPRSMHERNEKGVPDSCLRLDLLTPHGDG